MKCLMKYQWVKLALLLPLAIYIFVIKLQATNSISKNKSLRVVLVTSIEL